MSFPDPHRSLWSRARSSLRRRGRSGRPTLECLESRLTPATTTWTGSVSNLWSNAGNWSAGVPTAGSDVVFPGTGVSHLANQNDLTGLSLHSLTISGSGYTITGNSVSVTGTIDSSQDSGTNTVNLPIALGSTPSITVDTGGASLVLGGLLSGTNGLNKLGSGELDLKSNNAYTGSTTVTAGVLHVDGAQSASPVIISSGATLGGVGTVGAITSNGGVVRPGDSGPGILHDAGALTLNSGSVLAASINGTTAGTGYSQVSVAGAISINNAALNATLGFVPTGNAKFTLITNTGSSPIAGTFNGLAEDSQTTFSGEPFNVTYLGGTGHSFTLTHLVSSTVVVSPSATSTVFGQSVTLTATVSGSGGTPTGIVKFFSGTTFLGQGTLNAGAATLTTSALPTGSDSVTGQYSGDTSFAQNTSAGVTVTVAQASTITALTAAPNPSPFGQPVVLTATITPVSPGAGTVTGTVEFFNGTTSLGTGTVSGGIATLSTTSLPVGPASLTATYKGDTNFTTSTSSAFSQTVFQTQATTTTVTPSTDTAVFGQSVTLSATVTASGGGATPTGSVQFFSGTTLLGSAPLTGGLATFTTSALPVGSDSVTATYQGNSTYAPSTSTGSTVTVSQASTTTTVKASPSPGSVGQPVTLTATVKAVAPGAGTATGTVEFFNGTTSLGTGTVNSSGVATITTSTLPQGTASLTAKYDGDTNFTTSTSPAVTEDILPATTTTLTSSASSTTFGQSVTLTAHVTATGGGATPTGTVEFFSGTTSLGTATLNSSGVATLATGALPVGNDNVTAMYKGSTTLGSSTSTALTLTVAQASTTTTLTVSPSPASAGQTVTLTATVAPVSPGAGTPTGTVQFFNGSRLLGTGTLNSSGVATFTTSSLAVGTYSLTATYQTTTGYKTSTSSPVSLTVSPSSLPGTTTTLTVSKTTVGADTPVTLTATVTGSASPTGAVAFYANGTFLGSAFLSNGTATLTVNSLPIGRNAVTAMYAGDANNHSSMSNAVSVSVGTANEQFVNQVYLAVLYRPLDPAGAQFWNRQFALGRSREAIVHAITTSPEARRDAIQNIFQTYLGGRFGTPAQVADAIHVAESTGKGLRAAVLSSTEYLDLTDGTLSGYLGNLATNVTGTSSLPEPAQNYLASQIARGTPLITIAENVLLSGPGETTLVNSTFDHILGRPATAAELSHYISLLNKGVTVGQITQILLSSDEFFTLATS